MHEELLFPFFPLRRHEDFLPLLPDRQSGGLVEVFLVGIAFPSPLLSLGAASPPPPTSICSVLSPSLDYRQDRHHLSFLPFKPLRRMLSVPFSLHLGIKNPALLPPPFLATFSLFVGAAEGRHALHGVLPSERASGTTTSSSLSPLPCCQFATRFFSLLSFLRRSPSLPSSPPGDETGTDSLLLSRTRHLPLSSCLGTREDVLPTYGLFLRRKAPQHASPFSLVSEMCGFFFSFPGQALKIAAFRIP